MMVGDMKGGPKPQPLHPALQATTSHPITSNNPALVASEEARGASLGRNVQPPTSSASKFHLPALEGRPRPPSLLSEEPSDYDTDTESRAGVERSASVKLHPAGLIPPPPPNPRLSPWKEMTRTKGHARSVSHGGVTFTRTGSNRERQAREAEQSGAGTLPGQGAPGGAGGNTLTTDGQFKMPLASALKRPGHRRVFSESLQINADQTVIPGHMKSQTKAASKTDFILPAEHVDRERRSSVGVTGSGRGSGHKRGHSRGDSIGQYFRDNFRGHSRQASRTDSIYTLRQNKPNVRDKFRFWQKTEDTPPVERKCRKVVPNHRVPADTKARDHPNSQYLSNRIRTTKYTILSFLPRNLFEQFHRFANLYFLFIVLLNWVPAVNAFGKEISMLPIMIIMFVTSVKDLFEDRKRYLSDKKVNNNSCRVYNHREEKWESRCWKELRAGDLVHLSNDEMIPADILLLHTSDPNGYCYIDTLNLDGETNLKQREVPRGLKITQDGRLNPKELLADLECDAPTTKIYRFHGSLVQPWGERIVVGKDNLLLRECIVKNTDFVEGLVVYAGHESKAMLNNGGPRYKRSKLEKKINLDVIWCAVILVCLCLGGAIGSGTFIDSFVSNAPFLSISDEVFNEQSHLWIGFLAFWTFIIILQVIIPLSLYVTVEIVKLVQVYLIHNDKLMYDAVHDKSTECRALNIPEELGQVEFMFCDKTGTLTENKMVFKRCAIMGQDFNHNSFSHKSSGRSVIPVNPRLAEHLNNLDIQQLLEGTESNLSPMCANMREFFLLLAVCNTVVVAKSPKRDTMDARGHIMDKSPEPESVNSTLSRPVRMAEVPPPSLQTSASSPPASRSSNLAARSMTPSPPPSIVSTVSSTAGLATSATPTSLSNAPARRPRLLNIMQNAAANRPLSPVPASPTSPADSPSSRPKSSNLSSLLNPLNKLASLTSNHSLGKSSKNKMNPKPESRPFYEAESPDELALVDAAFAYNFKLTKRSPSSIQVSLPGEGKVEFELLNVLPFDSVRKRMSVLLKNPNTGEIKLYCKGADSNMLPRFTRPQNQDEERLLEDTQEHLKSYAEDGLRTLMTGVRLLSEEEYQDWLTEFNKASNSLEKRDKLLMDSYNTLENRMRLVGATGIEDRLQEGVPDAIARLREAGIVVWVLTGDKQETAINIAFSCRLFSPNMEVIKLNARSRDAAESALNLYLDQCKNSTMLRSQRALVVDGKTLIYILDKRANIQDLFLSLTKMCSSVLACRATPLQKAYLVRIVKEQLRMHTLAIGDGANDVSMIQTADIGIGISGQEGMQAVMASDFAVTRFKYIERLLLVHGHWNYERTAKMVLHFFFKNSAFVFTVFWFQIYCGFSGQVMIDQIYLMLFNMFFTSWTPFTVGMFDHDASSDLLSSRPGLYYVGSKGTLYRNWSFWVNILEALYVSLVVFFIAFGQFSGSDLGLWELGTLQCSQLILAMTLQLGIQTKSWTWMQIVGVLLSVMIYVVFGLIYNGVCYECEGLTNPYWVMQNSLSDPAQWLILVLTGVLVVAPRLCVQAWSNTLHPSDLVLALRLDKRTRDTQHRMDQVETRNGFVKFFRSSSDATVSVSSISKVESLNDTEMTNMTTM